MLRFGLFGKLPAFLSVDPVLCTLKVLDFSSSFYYFTSSVPTLRSQFVNNDSVVLNGKYMSFYEICKIQLKNLLDVLFCLWCICWHMNLSHIIILTAANKSDSRGQAHRWIVGRQDYQTTRCWQFLLAAHSLGLVRYLNDCIYSQKYSPPFFHCYFSLYNYL